MFEKENKYEIEIVADNFVGTAQLKVTVKDWSENGKRNRPCQIELEWENGQIIETSHNVYRAFQLVRERLECLGLSTRCYGACEDVQASGMQCDMGDGTFAYRLSTAKDNELPMTVNIFETEEGLEIHSVSRQRNYLG